MQNGGARKFPSPLLVQQIKPKNSLDQDRGGFQSFGRIAFYFVKEFILDGVTLKNE